MRLGFAVALSLAAVFLAVCPSPANALSITYCNDYAKRAADAVAKAKAAGCVNNEPARWGTDANEHKRWCRSTSNQEAADRETALREDRAGQCVLCRGFSNLVAQAHEKNQQLGCNFQPNVANRTWASPEEHYQFCQSRPNTEGGSSAVDSSWQHINSTTDDLFGQLARCRIAKRRPAPPKITSTNFCRNYADRAVAAAATAKAAGCNFGDARWTSTRIEHERWCLFQTDNGVVEAETAHRHDRSTQCSECREYAKLAVEAAHQNAANKCGGTGPRWSTNEQGHFSWCETLQETTITAGFAEGSRALADPETNAREGHLARCIANRPKTGTTQQPLVGTPGGGGNPSVSRRVTTFTDVPNASFESGKKKATGSTPRTSDLIGHVPRRSGNTAMDRLAPGGGGSNDVYSGGSAGSRPARGGSGGAGGAAMSNSSLGDNRPVKSFGRSRGDSSVDYGFNRAPAPPRPVK
jgi:hypothetical protein